MSGLRKQTAGGRVQGEYGKSLLKRPGEPVERSYAHCNRIAGMCADTCEDTRASSSGD